METRGLPLLSGPPPAMNDMSSGGCRKCGREFNVLFSRSKKCNHCGYLYCNLCTDYQALMPRTGDDSGYVVMPVCAYCIDFLNVTAAGKGLLRTFPISRLRRYVEAYNIKVDRAVEKDDLINGILAARDPNGCLLQTNEEYYRRNSVPNQGRGHSSRSRGRFSRHSGASDSAPQEPPPPPPNRPVFPRPDLAPDRPPPPPPPPPPPLRPHQEQSIPPPLPPRPSSYTHTSSTMFTPPPPPPPPRPNNIFSGFPNTSDPLSPSPPPPPSPPQNHWWNPSPPAPNIFHTHSSSNPLNVPSMDHTSRARTTSVPTHPTALTLDDLLTMTSQRISTLSISVLKSILLANHVNAGMVLEKGELVTKVQNLVVEERRNRERQRMVEEAEECERQEKEKDRMEEEQQRSTKENATTQDADSSNNTATPPPASKHKPVTISLDREGLCVVCYDNDANIAIVDCGHLAMCRECSDLIMTSSRECPLCRTRIVTESRLLRIFKT